MWPFEGLSLSAATSAYNIANAFFIASLVVGVIATFVLVRTGAVKEEYLRRDLAATNERTEKLKAVVAWRTIPPDVATTLENALAAHPGSVNLRYMDGDPEALFLAIQISQILAKAHWQVAPGAAKPANSIIFGLGLPDAVGADAINLRAAFTASNVDFSSSPISPMGGFNITTIAGAPTLMVGSRMPVLP
jgi:hypothetical protein